MPSYLVTGSSRGLGLAFTQKLLETPDNFVIATARNLEAAKSLQSLKQKYSTDRLALLPLDVIDAKSVAAAAEAAAKLLPAGLDNLISNAGISSNPLLSFDELDIDDFRNDVEFTLTSTVLILRAFLPLIRASAQKKIMVLTSSLGSIEIAPNLPGLANTYSVSKAALNMLIRKWGGALKQDGITSFVIHPGWVKSTDLGDTITPWMEKYAPDEAVATESDSVEGCLKVLREATLDHTGSFYIYDGTLLPW